MPWFYFTVKNIRFALKNCELFLSRKFSDSVDGFLLFLPVFSNGLWNEQKNARKAQHNHPWRNIQTTGQWNASIPFFQEDRRSCWHHSRHCLVKSFCPASIRRLHVAFLNHASNLSSLCACLAVVRRAVYTVLDISCSWTIILCQCTCRNRYRRTFSGRRFLAASPIDVKWERKFGDV